MIGCHKQFFEIRDKKCIILNTVIVPIQSESVFAKETDILPVCSLDHAIKHCTNGNMVIINPALTYLAEQRKLHAALCTT